MQQVNSEACLEYVLLLQDTLQLHNDAARCFADTLPNERPAPLAQRSNGPGKRAGLATLPCNATCRPCVSEPAARITRH